MRTLTCLALLFAATVAAAEDPNPDDLPGQWELKEGGNLLPAGTIFDFKKEGKLLVTLPKTAKGAEKKAVEFGWSLKKSTMSLELPTKKSDTTEVTKLTKTELEFKDANGTVAKFKRLETPKAKEQDKEKP